jgi:DNA modification methylase
MTPMIQTQLIYCGDNLQKLKELPDRCVDLIYIDPPFNSNRNYEVFWGDTQEKRSFDDRFGAVEDYIRWMRPRVMELYRVLKETGSFYYHCDWHAGHYVKVMLDQILGAINFQNEIVWKRTSSHSGSRKFGPIHDTIFFYTKSGQYTWNPHYDPMNSDRKLRHDLVSDANGRLFRTSDLTGSGTRNGESGKPWRGYDPTKRGRHWGIPRELAEGLSIEHLPLLEKLDALDEAGLIYYPEGDSLPRYKKYIDDDLGMTLGTVWTDIPPINSQSSERLGYPTQKPLALLERIIKASSNPGDLVLDAFCGCGTALVSAQNLGRKWIGIDISPTSCRVMANRLQEVCKVREGEDFWVRDLPKTAEQLRAYPPFEFENWAVNALNTVVVNGHSIGNKAKVGDMGIDGRIYPASVEKAKRAGRDLLGDIDAWFPVQVKQKDKVGRPEVDQFETAMRRQGREKGFFVAFGYSSDAMKEIERVMRSGEMEIIPITVDEILSEERMIRV